MKKISQHKTYVSELLELLSGEKIAMLDFDRLKQWLVETATMLTEAERQESELALLRHDYISRISGMAKAIAAVDRHKDSLQTVLAYVESLPSLTSSELVTQYKRMQAKFHDAFPTSFGALLNRTRMETGRNLEVFK